MKRMLRSLWHRLLDRVSDTTYMRSARLWREMTRGRLPRWPNLESPKTWGEKTMYLSLTIDRLIPGAREYTDKLAVRRYVESTVGSEHLVPLLGVWEAAGDIDWEAMPQRFVLKANHGSSFNILVPDKARLDVDRAVRRLDRWMAQDYSRISREKQYRSIERRVLAEEFLGSGTEPPPDLKFYCFGGRTGLVEVTSTAGQWCFDREWRPLDVRPLGTRVASEPFPRPSNLEAVVTVAETLAAPFFYVRVDLYNVDGHVFFGEITFTPGGGRDPWRPRSWERRFGDMIVLPDER